MNLRPEIKRQEVLLRPEKYLGDLKEIEESVWIVQNNKMVFKKIKYSPALLKLYDQILCNAAQNKLKDNNTSFIQIRVGTSKNDSATVSISNDGKPISLIKVGDDQHYLLQSIFGASPMPPNQQQQGYSVKLVNIFSKYFYVETGQIEKRCAVKLQWINNMETISKTQQIEYQRRDYTKVGFKVDMQKLGLRAKKFSENLIGLMERRAYDIAGLLRVKVQFNEKHIQFSNFSQYAKMFVKDENLMFYDKVDISPRWNVILAKSSSNVGYQHLTFVNSCIWTRRGGTHSDAVLRSIADKAMLVYNKRFKNPDLALKREKLHSSYMLFISFYIEDPEFQGPLKDKLISPILNFSSDYNMSDEAFDFLEKHKLLEIYKEIAMQRENKKIENQIKKEASKSKLIISRLEEAFNIGVSSRCTLIIVENEATKTLLLNGLEYVKKSYFGILSLKYKPVNVREMNHKQLLQVHDFNTIIKALGLTVGQSYESIDGLRYSSVLIAFDSDTEGIENKGLLLNFFDTFWPSLFKIKGFIKILLLPAIRCTNSLGLTKEFLSEEQYLQWKALEASHQTWTVQKYNGYGSMNFTLMRELMQQPKKWIFNVVFKTTIDTIDENCLKSYFHSKKMHEKRKKMLEQYKFPSNFCYNKENNQLSITDFVHKDLIGQYYQEQQKLVVNCIDGLNTIQRKALIFLMQRNTDTPIKITQLAGKIIEESKWDFGESLIQHNLIAMGQNYVGSNNLNLLQPIGQFGSRYHHGKDSAPPKHLLASFPKLTQLLFPEDDIHVLPYKDCSEGLREPQYLVPILPVLLINGSRDINNSTWANTVFGHRVLDVIDMTKAKIQKVQKTTPPSWQGYKGPVEMERKGFYFSKGIFQVKGKCVRITEIPINRSIKQFKSSLQEHLSGQKGDGSIEIIRESHNGSAINFILKFHTGKLPKTDDLEKYLKLSYCLIQNNIVILNSEGKFQKYDHIGLILNDYYTVRFKAYEKRKEYLISKKQREIQEIREKIKFIKEVLSGEFHLGETQETWETKFSKKGYKKYKEFTQIKSTFVKQLQSDRNYFHLYQIKIEDFNEKKLRQLKEEKQNLEQSLALIKKTDEKSMWLKDISMFQEQWKMYQKKRDEIEFQLTKKPDQIIKEPSQPSVKKRNIDTDKLPIEPLIKKKEGDIFDTFKMDQPPELQRPKTEEMVVQPKIINNDNIPVFSNSKADIKTQEKLEINFDIYNQGLVDLVTFRKKLAIMERQNIEFRQRQAREKNQEIERQEQAREKIRRERMLEEKNKKKMEAARKAQAETPKINGQQRRQDLANEMKQITQKLEEEEKRKALEKQEQSQQSERNHLSKGPKKAPPQMTVPYEYKDFTVNHVERKRFSTREMRNKKNDDDLHKIQAQLQKEELNQKKKKNESNFINLDD